MRDKTKAAKQRQDRAIVGLPGLLKTATVAAKIDVTEKYVRGLIKQGELEGFQLEKGGHWFVPTEAYLAYLDGLRSKTRQGAKKGAGPKAQALQDRCGRRCDEPSEQPIDRRRASSEERCGRRLDDDGEPPGTREDDEQEIDWDEADRLEQEAEALDDDGLGEDEEDADEEDTDENDEPEDDDGEAALDS